MISSRYHAALVGAWSGAQVLVVERNAKLTGLAAQLGLNSVPAFLDAREALRALSEARPIARSALERLADATEQCCREFFRRASLPQGMLRRVLRGIATATRWPSSRSSTGSI
jgi:hypothetical protein